MYNGWTPTPKRILTEAEEQGIKQRESNCAERAALATHAGRNAYKALRPGEYLAMVIRNHEKECPLCQAELAPAFVLELSEVAS
ncbi:MAG: hypothetical protein KF698_08425 [Anaerolineales bacterium]|nr:hypothetical protein [Anaerolineales bacterium]